MFVSRRGVGPIALPCARLNDSVGPLLLFSSSRRRQRSGASVARLPPLRALPGPPDDADIPRRVYFGPIGNVPAWEDQVVQSVGVPDVWSGDLDALPEFGCFRRHEARAGGAVIGKGKLAILRDDLYDQVWTGMAWTSLIGIGGRQQMPVVTAQPQLDMDIAIGFSAHAVDSAGDGDAPVLHD